MAMELTTFRLYAPYFGNSIYVWGSMISVVMLALAAGYALGGWLADRKPFDNVLYAIVLASGVYQLAIVFLVRPLLLELWTLGDFAGPVLATVLIFGPPMTALAMTSPFVIRLLVRAGHVGATVGSVFALSTAGSIAGVLGTSFWLVPRFGTRATLEVLCGASIALGVAGLIMRRARALLLVPLAIVPFLSPNPKPPAGIMWSGESTYNRILVFEQKGLRWLVLNDPRFFQTIVKVGSADSGFYLDEFALGPVIVPAKNLVVLGLGAGRSVQVSRAVAAHLEIDAVEIDPEVINVARRFFGFPTADPKMRVHVADARPWLAQYAGKADLIHADLFQGGPYVPFYLATVEFFELVRSRLTDNGMLIVNVYDPGKNQKLLSPMGATLSRVFPSLEVLSRDDGNHIIFAFARQHALSDTVARLNGYDGVPWVRDLARKSAPQIADFQPTPGAVAFTDDLAPVEEITHRMLREAKR
jgi:MFS family permease